MGKEATGKVVEFTQELFEMLSTVEEGSRQFYAIREEIVKVNYNLIYFISQKYLTNKTQYLFDDMVSAGQMGLLKAINHYDFKKGILFGTFAGRCIENEVLMLLRHEKRYSKNVSLESLVYKESDNNFTVEDTIAEPRDYIEEAHDEFEKEYQKGVLAEALKRLSPKQLTVIKLYALDDHKRTQVEIAKTLKISQSYVSRIIKQSIKTLHLAAVRMEKGLPIKTQEKVINVRAIPPEEESE